MSQVATSVTSLGILFFFFIERLMWVSFCRFCQNFDEELVRKTKLSDILVFSGITEKTQKSFESSSIKSFKLASNSTEDDFVQRKLNLLREAPVYECAGSPSKKLKISIKKD